MTVPPKPGMALTVPATPPALASARPVWDQSLTLELAALLTVGLRGAQGSCHHFSSDA